MRHTGVTLRFTRDQIQQRLVRRDLFGGDSDRDQLADVDRTKVRQSAHRRRARRSTRLS